MIFDFFTYSVYGLQAIYLAWLLILTVFLFLQQSRKKPEKYSGVAVDIIVPFYNDAASISKTLESINNQDYPLQLHVVLVNDCSTDNSLQIVKEWLATNKPKFMATVINTPFNKGRKAPATIEGYKHIRKNAWAFMVLDGDTYMEPDAVSLLVNKLASEPNSAGACGRVLINENSNSSFITRLQASEHRTGYVHSKYGSDYIGRNPVMSGALSIHRTSVVPIVGMWDESWLVEDICWSAIALSKGYYINFEPRAIAHTYCPDTYNGLFRQRRRWARGKGESIKAAFAVNPNLNLLIRCIQHLDVIFIIPTIVLLLFLDPVAWGFLAAYIGLEIVGNVITYRKLGERLPLGRFVKDLLYSRFIIILMLPATTLGVIDEIRCLEKKWLTR